MDFELGWSTKPNINIFKNTLPHLVPIRQQLAGEINLSTSKKLSLTKNYSVDLKMSRQPVKFLADCLGWALRTTMLCLCFVRFGVTRKWKDVGRVGCVDKYLFPKKTSQFYWHLVLINCEWREILFFVTIYQLHFRHPGCFLSFRKSLLAIGR